MPPKLLEEDAVAFMRAHDFEPTTPYPLSRKPWPGYCLKCGHPSSPTHSQVLLGKSPCPYCSLKNKKTDSAILVGKMLGAYWDVGDNPFPGVAKSWKGVCTKCGEEGVARYRDIQTRKIKYACSYCNGSRIHADKAKAVFIAQNFYPSIPFPGAGHPWAGVCHTCGQPGSPRYSTVNKGVGACEYCAKIKVDSAVIWGKMLAADFLPSVPYPGKAIKPWPGVCLKCGRHGNSRYNAVQAGKQPCLYCAGFMLDKTIVEGKCIALNFSPEEPYPGKALLDWHGKCLKCNSKIITQWVNLQQGGVSCRTCNPPKIGYDSGKIGFLYLVRGPHHMKIGISNDPSNRISCHTSFANQILELWIGSGVEALKAERIIKRALNHSQYGLPIIPGSRETWKITKENEHIFTIKDLIKYLEKNGYKDKELCFDYVTSGMVDLSKQDISRVMRNNINIEHLFTSYSKLSVR